MAVGPETVDFAGFGVFLDGMPVAYGKGVGLWFTAGRRKCWGEPGRHFRMGCLHPILYFRTPVLLWRLAREAVYAAPSGYSSASFSSRDSVSTVVPVRFHAPSLSKR